VTPLPQVLDNGMGKIWACFTMVCSLACGDAEGGERSCADVACGGSYPPVALVDENGLPVVARGEVQNRDLPEQPFPFDCTVSSPSSGCQGNAVVTGTWGVSPGYVAQIRFEQSDGSFTAWQPVRFHVTSRTDPDFNGPGCLCTRYTATAEDVIVPVSARLSAGADAGAR
jgi:hypothetical protein